MRKFGEPITESNEAGFELFDAFRTTEQARQNRSNLTGPNFSGDKLSPPPAPETLLDAYLDQVSAEDIREGRISDTQAKVIAIDLLQSGLSRREFDEHRKQLEEQLEAAKLQKQTVIEKYAGRLIRIASAVNFNTIFDTDHDYKPVEAAEGTIWIPGTSEHGTNLLLEGVPRKIGRIKWNDGPIYNANLIRAGFEPAVHIQVED